MVRGPGFGVQPLLGVLRSDLIPLAAKACTLNPDLKPKTLNPNTLNRKTLKP